MQFFFKKMLISGLQAAATPVGSRTLVGNHKSREGEDERRACVADFYLQQILLLAELCVGRNNDRCCILREVL